MDRRAPASEKVGVELLCRAVEALLVIPDLEVRAVARDLDRGAPIGVFPPRSPSFAHPQPITDVAIRAGPLTGKTTVEQPPRTAEVDHCSVWSGVRLWL